MQRCKPVRHVLNVGLLAIAFLMIAACQEPGGQTPATGAPSAPATTAVAAVPSEGSLTAYSPGSVPPKVLRNCNVERLNDEMFGAQPLVLGSSQAISITGWADPSDVPDSRIWLRFDDAPADQYLHAPVTLTTARADVQLHDPKAPLKTGFSIELPTDALPAGSYHIYLAVTSANSVYVCDNGRQVKIVSR